jgi:hypothetical protein
MQFIEIILYHCSDAHEYIVNHKHDFKNRSLPEGEENTYSMIFYRTKRGYVVSQKDAEIKR